MVIEMFNQWMGTQVGNHLISIWLVIKSIIGLMSTEMIELSVTK